MTMEDALIGQVIGDRYLIEARLGKGAMGAVYRARHVKMSRRFAVKMLHPHLLANAKLRRRFEREAELAGTLQHPNCVNVVDVGETNGQHYLVMELAEGPSLQDLLGAPFAADRAVALVRQLLDGLHHAHQHGVIHRDFKPDNVIIETHDGSETPRIVDFGIARLVEEAPTHHGRLTTDGLVLGTPEYMAPEQAMNKPIDLRIDLFALGVVMYELLSGTLPFEGSGVEVAMANVTKDAPPMHERAPGVTVDPLLEAFARKLMSRKPDERPASARAARRILDVIESDRTLAAELLGVERAPISETIDVPIAAARMPSELHSVAEEIVVEVIPPHPSTLELVPVRNRARTIALVAISSVVVGLVLLVALRHKPEPVISTQPAQITFIDAGRAPEVVVVDPKVAGAPPDAGLVAVELPQPPPQPVPPKPIPKPHPVAPPPPATPLPPPPKPVPASDPTSTTILVGLYTSVGRELKTLRERAGTDVTADLWRRYLLIQLNDAMSSPARRGAAIEVLTEIRRETTRIQKASERN